MQEENTGLVNKCLIATPAIRDPLFAASLVYLCEHNTSGSMGLVINHPTDQPLSKVLEQLDIDCDDEQVRSQPVYLGGPVQLEQGFVLHTDGGSWQKSIEVIPGIYVTSSVDVLQAIAERRGPREYLVMLGFSGWAPGQLESELQENAWLTASIDTDLMFHQNADDKWQKAVDSLGFDIANLSPVSGNA